MSSPVPPPVDPDRFSDPETLRSNLREREHLLDAVHRFLSAGPEGMALLYGAADLEEARTLLREHHGLDDAQASAVLDLQVRLVPGVQRQRLEADLRDVRSRLEELSGT